MENFEKCTVAMLGGPCLQQVTGNTSRLNQPQSAIIPDISQSCISRNLIYRSHLLDPILRSPRVQYFWWNRGNSWDPICGRQFSTKSAHRDSLYSRLQETIFHEISASPPVNAGWNTCCAMVSHARQSIDTSIVSQSRVQLIQCQCKLRLQIANLAINNTFLIVLSLTTLFTSAILSRHWYSSVANQERVIGKYSSSGICTPK